MTVAQLPPGLKAAVDAVLAGMRQSGLRQETAALSQHYRSGGISDASVSLNAYLTARLPATFAAVSRVLKEVCRRRPDWSPASVLDAGSGPGTASWAAAALWPEVGRITMLDQNESFLALAGQLAAHAEAPALAGANRIVADLAGQNCMPGADLVIASYALAELPAAALARTAEALWNAAGDTLVIVEPGTPAGFSRLREARARLIAAGAVPLAPCPHLGACPMAGEDWCHFSVRLARSRAHMQAKQARVPFEDEKFAYLALSRQTAPSGGARVLAPPDNGKAGIGFRLCTAKGVEQRFIARRDAAAYKAHRKLEWGDFISPEWENGA